MKPPKRRVVVVGRSGQVAHATGRRLRQDGHDVVHIARPDADLAEPDEIKAAIAAARPDIVVNSAAYTAVDKAEDEPEIAEAINATGAGAVAEAARLVGAPIIHFSTDYVFDGSKSSAYLETDACNPLGVYGRTKLKGEQLVAQAGPKHVILRTAWVCSPYGSNFVKTMLRLAESRPALNVVDDQHGSPTFADDLAQAVSALVPRLMEPSVADESFGIFNAANAGETTWCRFARAVLEGARLRGGPHVPVHAITTSEYPTKARRPAYSLLATNKLRDVHGIALRPWDQALSDCLDTLIRPVRA